MGCLHSSAILSFTNKYLYYCKKDVLEKLMLSIVLNWMETFLLIYTTITFKEKMKCNLDG